MTMPASLRGRSATTWVPASTTQRMVVAVVLPWERALTRQLTSLFSLASSVPFSVTSISSDLRVTVQRTGAPSLREKIPEPLAATTKAAPPRITTAMPPASSIQNLVDFFCARRDGAADGEPFGDPASLGLGGGDRFAGAGVGRSLG